jgi:hypothetical protein
VTPLQDTSIGAYLGYAERIRSTPESRVIPGPRSRHKADSPNVSTMMGLFARFPADSVRSTGHRTKVNQRQPGTRPGDQAMDADRPLGCVGCDEGDLLEAGGC